ncbi:methylmalonic aciduria type A homolog, mitochondrial [Lepeophtheirus salmonis]|uniref:methylmalonic aciduria type A homolog, mitochondrial n=1 Tax=Lepeophtheirus salmonis TaxID=72036 RepID=UPI003AF3F90D
MWRVIRRFYSTDNLLKGVLNHERQALARAITLVESTNKQKMKEARYFMSKITEVHHLANANTLQCFRLGLSGPPGAGKSTFIEKFGVMLTSQGKKVAVLAVDPSSGSTGGSLLGDKTRMPELTRDPNAFIRPSPNCCHLGGVTRNTNEAIAVCEAAGFNFIIVETVGVGQSEYHVADMVDMFALLIPPAGGDELQGFKRGIMEQGDLIIVNKADGDLEPAARRIKGDYLSALKFMRPKSKYWRPKVKLMSSKTKVGLPEVWEKMQEFQKVMTQSGELRRRRAVQHKKWMWNYIEDKLIREFSDHPLIKHEKNNFESQVMNYQLPPGTAADILLEKFFSTMHHKN